MQSPIVSLADLISATAAAVEPDAKNYTVIERGEMPDESRARGTYSPRLLCAGLHRVALVDLIDSQKITPRSVRSRAPYMGYERIDADWARTSKAYGLVVSEVKVFCEELAVNYSDVLKLLGIEVEAQSIELEQATPAPAKRVLASEVQDSTILDAIRKAGNNPLALPKNPSGKSGVKASVRAALVGKSPPFPKVGRQFDKAWDRLRSRGEIQDEK